MFVSASASSLARSLAYTRFHGTTWRVVTRVATTSRARRMRCAVRVRRNHAGRRLSRGGVPSPLPQEERGGRKLCRLH